MSNFGNLSLTLAFAFALYATMALFAGARMGRRELVKSGEHAVYVFFGLVTLSTLSLVYLLAQGAFHIEYVSSVSNREMPMFYKLAALWGGQAGSLLFWTFIISTYAALVAFRNRHRRTDLVPVALGVMSALLVLQARPLFEAIFPIRPGKAGLFVDAFLVTAFPEELAKLAAFWTGAFMSRELDEPLDGIIYAIAAALGFASVENVVYLIRFEDASVILMRGFTATPGHAAFSGALGFFFGLARFSEGPRRYALMGAGLLLAVVLHGLYDICLFSGGALAAIGLLVVLPLSLALLSLKIRWARARSPEFHGDPVSSPRGDSRIRKRRRRGR